MSDSTNSNTVLQTSIPVSQSSSERRVVLSCLFGSMLEFYDFMLYGLLAPAVFDKLFFPHLSPAIGVISIMAVFAVGYIARPLGGLVFGHWGDRIGRKPTMVVSLLMTGVATASIGFLPTYAMVGAMAPILLTILRFVQGFAIGGESTGAPILVMESCDPSRRGYFASIVQIGVYSGTALGALAGGAIALLPHDEMMSWGWRIPFIASIVLVLVGLYIRNKVMESPVFLAACAQPSSETPLKAVFRRESRAAFTVLAMCLAEGAQPNLFSVFGLVYALQHTGVSRFFLMLGLIAGNVIGSFTCPLYGRLSDRIGRRPMMATGFILCGLYAPMFFQLLRDGKPWLAAVAMAIPVALFQPIVFGTEGSFYPELFRDPRIRFTGCAFGRQLGGLLGGGLFPLIAAALMASLGTSAVVIYFEVLTVVSISAVIYSRRIPKTRT
jgi:MHS family shikimate/dehydroshikimate transporter-like MFS transporter